MANPTQRKHKWVPLASPQSPAAETYKTLRTSIQLLSSKRKLKTIMVTSALPSEGKTTVISNLAIAYAQAKKRVLLVDCDFRKPSLHYYFPIMNRSGFSSVLASGSCIDEAIQTTKVANLSLLPAGAVPSNPAELLNSDAMAEAMAHLTERFDIVLIDAPPALVIADAHIVADHCDGIVLVADSRRTKREIVKKAADRLKAGNAALLGVVLNYQKNALESAYRDYY